jgi:Flp pilus assembly protein TadG
MTRIEPHRRKGAATVEFALVAPFFIVLLLGSLEFGRGFMVQQTITNATREGAREAVLPDATVDSVKTTAVDCLARASIDISAEDVTVVPDPATAFESARSRII